MKGLHWNISSTLSCVRWSPIACVSARCNLI